MKLSKIISSVFLSSSIIGTAAVAETMIAPQSRINLWVGSSAIADTNFTVGTTTALGKVKILKSNASVINALNSGLYMSGSYLSSKMFYGSPHQSVSENGTTDAAGTSRQCVAFAKAMTGAKSTPNWYKGWSITSYVDLATMKQIPAPSLVLQGGLPLQPGTMIAHFQGQSKYPTSQPYGHVAIFLNWTYNTFTGQITGMDVVDENLIQLIAETGGSAAGLIQKHWLPWRCTAGSQCGTNKYLSTFYASNYHVVDVR
jgi:hypothetical protein